LAADQLQDVDQHNSTKSSSEDDDEAGAEAAGAGARIGTQKGQAARQGKMDHAFNTLIGVLANNQFTAQTYLTLAYRQLRPSAFLQMSRRLAHHGFWGRLLTWAFLFVKEDSSRLQALLEQQDQGLLQTVNDEAEMFEVFNPAVSCQRVRWNADPLPQLSGS